MTKNPIINALAAVAYIAAVASFLFYVAKRFENAEGTVFVPIAMLSLVVFSVAFMAYTFFYQPIQMYIDGEKREAARLFLHTLLTFAIITALAFIAMIVAAGI